MKSLFCTFSTIENYKNVIKEIRNFYTDVGRNIFVFSDGNNKHNIVLSYSVFFIDKKFDRLPRTIGVHRKKETNTLYTLNAMNILISEENHGIFNENIILDWELYRNSLILSSDVSVKIIPLSLLSIDN